MVKTIPAVRNSVNTHSFGADNQTTPSREKKDAERFRLVKDQTGVYKRMSLKPEHKQNLLYLA